MKIDKTYLTVNCVFLFQHLVMCLYGIVCIWDLKLQTSRLRSDVALVDLNAGIPAAQGAPAEKHGSCGQKVEADSTFYATCCNPARTLHRPIKRMQVHALLEWCVNELESKLV